MGLASFSPTAAAERGATLHLRHPATGEPIVEKMGGKDVAATLTVLGRDSAAVKDAQKGIAKRRAAGEEIPQEEAGLLVMAAAITGWSRAVCIQKVGDLPYTPENAVALLRNRDTEWVAEQIGPFTMSRRNFVQKPT